MWWRIKIHGKWQDASEIISGSESDRDLHWLSLVTSEMVAAAEQQEQYRVNTRIRCVNIHTALQRQTYPSISWWRMCRWR